MNKIKIIMKLQRLILVFLILFPLLAACSASSTTSTPPTPVVKWPLDVSKRNSKVNQQFKIIEYRSYYFALHFAYDTKGSEVDSQNNGRRLQKLVGHGSREDEGIKIPIHLKINKLDSGSFPPQLIYEDTILTRGIYAGTFGYLDREIIEIDLKPGTYLVNANTIEDRPEFSGTPTYLAIEPHSQIKFLPRSIKIK